MHHPFGRTAWGSSDVSDPIFTGSPRFTLSRAATPSRIDMAPSRTPAACCQGSGASGTGWIVHAVFSPKKTSLAGTAKYRNRCDYGYPDAGRPMSEGPLTPGH